MKELYRFVDVRYAAPLDEWDSPCGVSQLEIRLDRYRVLSETKCGAWIAYCGGKRFVNLVARKKFACSTQELALESFKARKTAQIRIYEARLADAKQAKFLADAHCCPKLEHALT